MMNQKRNTKSSARASLTVLAREREALEAKAVALDKLGDLLTKLDSLESELRSARDELSELKFSLADIRAAFNLSPGALRILKTPHATATPGGENEPDEHHDY